MKIIWENKTDEFTEQQRHYKDKYLEICNVYNDEVEVNLYSSCDDYEIYINYGIMFGISYVSKANAYQRFEEIKKDIEKEIQKHGSEPSDKFIDEFCKKYDVVIPDDIFMDFF